MGHDNMDYLANCLNLDGYPLDEHVPDYVAVWPASEHSQREAKPNEVWPVVLNVRKPTVEFPAHIKPFVFKGIQRVEQAHVD